MGFVEQSEQDAYDYMKRILLEKLSDEHVMLLAKDCVKQIDWTNPSLMHKGFRWIVQNYFTRIGMPWEHSQENPTK